MNESELMKSVKPFPGSEPVVYARKDLEVIYLGKDVVVLSPVGKPLDGPTVFPPAAVPAPAAPPAPPAPAVDLKVEMEKFVNDKLTELNKKFDEQLKAKEAELAALKAENEKLKAPAAPKAEAPKAPVENKKKLDLTTEEMLKKALVAFNRGNEATPIKVN